MSDSSKYFYRRYPGTTILMVVLVLTFGLLKVADMFLYKRALQKQAIAEKQKEEQPAWIFSPINRVVRLRELRPNMAGFVQPSKEYLVGAENLVDKKYFVHTDSDGFMIDPNTSQTGESKIVFLGGSTTECIYVTENLRFPFLAAKKISEQINVPIISKSGGVSGNHSMHAINLLVNKVIPLKPKVAVLMENVNDLNVMLYEKNYWNKNVNRSLVMDTGMIAAYNRQFPSELIERPEGFLKNVFPYLSLRYAVAKHKWEHAKSTTAINEWSGSNTEKIAINTQQLESDFRSSIKTFVVLCKAWGIVPVLMTQQNRIIATPDRLVAESMKPLEKRGVKYADYVKQYEKFNRIIREVAQAEEVTLIDLDKLVPKTPEYIYDAVHVNDKGSSLIADIVSNNLKDIFGKQ